MQTRRPPILRALLVTCLSPIAGCGVTATLTLDDGREIEAEIVGGDRDVLTVSGAEPPIARARIVDIDYPGGLAQGIGIGVGGAGVVYGIMGGLLLSEGLGIDPDFEREIGVAVTGFGVGLAAIGAWLFVDGLLRERASREASRPPGGSLVVQPFVGPAGIGVRF